MFSEMHQETEHNPYFVRLDVFEGPLDLLLHLIKQNEMDIYNIQIALITEQYLKYLEMMKELNLDIAGEFLLMAATLAHIKSQMLLPPDTQSQEDSEEEEFDPREELIRRLLEYQKYKDAAEKLLARPLLYRDIFIREHLLRMAKKEEAPRELMEISVFKLVEAFHRIIAELTLQVPYEVQLESVTLGECINFVVRAIRTSEEGSVRFQDLFKGERSRSRVIVTFLALLDLIKQGALRVFQADTYSDIQLIGTPLLYGEWRYDGRDEYTSTTEIDS